MLLYKPNAVLGIRSRSHFFYQCTVVTFICIQSIAENPKVSQNYLHHMGSYFAGIRMQSFSFAGQIFQVKTLDCSTVSQLCDTIEISIVSKNSEVYASTNHTLDLVIEDYRAGTPIKINPDYPESCCQYVTFFRHSYE